MLCFVLKLPRIRPANETVQGMKTPEKYPDQYLHVTECRSGQTWIRPLRDNARLDLDHWVRTWVKEEFNGELRIDGRLMPRIEGDYYAVIITDGRPPDSVVVWESGGFYLR